MLLKETVKVVILLHLSAFRYFIAVGTFFENNAIFIIKIDNLCLTTLIAVLSIAVHFSLFVLIRCEYLTETK